MPLPPGLAGDGASSRGAGTPVDHVYLLPVRRLFSPEPDPTTGFPEHAASVDGYVVAPDRHVTLALSVTSPVGSELLESIWSTVRRKGVGVRHLTVLNDRGHVVSLMTVRVDTSEEMLELLQSLLLVPVRTQNGLAEVHLLATPKDLRGIRERIEVEGLPEHPSTAAAAPLAVTAGPMGPQDWAFLGLLAAVGAFDGPTGMPPAALAEALGIELDAFVERARAAERGLHGVVEGLFGSGLRPTFASGAGA